MDSKRRYSLTPGGLKKFLRKEECLELEGDRLYVQGHVQRVADLQTLVLSPKAKKVLFKFQNGRNYEVISAEWLQLLAEVLSRQPPEKVVPVYTCEQSLFRQATKGEDCLRQFQHVSMVTSERSALVQLANIVLIYSQVRSERVIFISSPKLAQVGRASFTAAGGLFRLGTSLYTLSSFPKTPPLKAVLSNYSNRPGLLPVELVLGTEDEYLVYREPRPEQDLCSRLMTGLGETQQTCRAVVRLLFDHLSVEQLQHWSVAICPEIYLMSGDGVLLLNLIDLVAIQVPSLFECKWGETAGQQNRIRLGLTLYELTYGALPYFKDGAGLRQVLREGAVLRRGGVSDELLDFLTQLLQGKSLWPFFKEHKWLSAK